VQRERESQGFVTVRDVIDATCRARLLRLLEPERLPHGIKHPSGLVFAARHLLITTPRLSAELNEAGLDTLASAFLGPGPFPVDATYFDKQSVANWTVPASYLASPALAMSSPCARCSFTAPRLLEATGSAEFSTSSTLLINPTMVCVGICELNEPADAFLPFVELVFNLWRRREDLRITGGDRPNGPDRFTHLKERCDGCNAGQGCPRSDPSARPRCKQADLRGWTRRG